MITDKDKAAIEAHYADEKGLFEVPSKFKGDVALVRKYEDEIAALKAKINDARAKLVWAQQTNIGTHDLKIGYRALRDGVNAALEHLTQ